MTHAFYVRAVETMVRAVQEFDTNLDAGREGPRSQGTAAQMSEPTQKREIGFWTAVSLVIGSMIGSGVFGLPATLAAFGGISMLAWVITAFGSVMLALVFAHLSRRNPATGGVYAYARDAFGDFGGFIVAWGYWISMWTRERDARDRIRRLRRAAAVRAHRRARSPRGRCAAAAWPSRTLWFLTAVNTLGVRTAGRIQVVDDGAEADAAGHRRPRRPAGVQRGSLRDSGTGAGVVAAVLGDAVPGDDVHAVRLRRPRSGDGAGRRREGSRQAPFRARRSSARSSPR